jgi:4-hydroxybenzoate polyprenyltransferase
MFMAGDLTHGCSGGSPNALRYARRMDKLRRLWQPAKPLFWMMLGFNVLSSVCTWAMRALPLNTFGLLLVGTVALINVACGLLAAWQLMQRE